MPVLKVLHLHGNAIAGRAWDRIGRSVVRNPSMLQLTCTSGAGVLQLQQLRGADRTLEIALSNCALRDGDAVVIAALLHGNACLQSLDLSQNTICDVGGIALARELLLQAGIGALELCLGATGVHGARLLQARGRTAAAAPAATGKSPHGGVGLHRPARRSSGAWGNCSWATRARAKQAAASRWPSSLE